MSTIVIPGNHVFFVRWGCRKCGHERGVAKTTIPLPAHALNEVAVRALFDALKQKLMRKHFAGQGCLATIEDFRITRGTPDDAQIVGLV